VRSGLEREAPCLDGASLRRARPDVKRGSRALLVDVALLAIAGSARVVLERLRGLEHAAADLWTLFIPNFAWWWSAPRWLGGWNAWIFGGYPANADPQTAQLHPFGLLYALAPPLGAASLDGALTPTVAAIGMLLYLHRIGCGRTGSLIGALSFGLGGFVAAQAPHPAHLHAAVAVPWALAAIEALDGAALAAGLGASTAAIVLSGHPQTIVYALAVVIAYAGWLGRPTAPGRAVALAAGIALGIGVAAGAWLPASELMRASTHALGHVGTLAWPPPEDAARLRGVHLVGLVVPFAAGGAVGPLYGRSPESLACGVVECTGYPGMLAWLAVLSGVPAVLRDRRGRFWLVTGILGVVLATGVAGEVPPLRGVRTPARLLLWWNLAVAAGAAIALRRIEEPAPGRSQALSWWAAACLLAGFVAWSSTFGAAAHRAAMASAGVLALSTLAAASILVRAREGVRWSLVVALAADLVALDVSMPVGVPLARLRGSTGVLGVLREAMAITPSPEGRFSRSLVLPFVGAANWAPFEGTRLIQGYNALVPQALAALLGQEPSARTIEVGWITDATLAEPSSRVLDLLRVRTVASWAPRDALSAAIDAAADGTRWERRGSAGGLQLYLNRRARPVAWLVRRARVVPRETALRLVRGEEPGFDPTEEALVDRSIAGLTPTAASRDDPPPVAVVRYADDEIRLTAEPTRDALLVTSELAYPGWTAAIDGRRTPVLTVNAGFRAVVAPAGRHEVTFAYRPLVTRVGLGIGAGSLAILSGCALGARLRRRGPDRPRKRGDT